MLIGLFLTGMYVFATADTIGKILSADRAPRVKLALTAFPFKLRAGTTIKIHEG